MVLLPCPKKVQEQGGNYHLNFKAMIVVDSSCPEGIDVYAQMLQEEISSSTGIKIKRTRGLAKKGDIRLFVDESCFESRYYLDVNEDGITICGGDCLARAGGADATPVIPPVCGAFACGKD